jgi:hypothetical protein
MSMRHARKRAPQQCDNRLMQRLAVCLAFLLIATAVAEPGLAGKYVGEWKSSGSNGGAIRFTLDGPHAEIWHADLTFVLGGAEVPTVMRDVKVKVSNIDLTYDFDTQGATLRSHVTGDWDGAAFKGKYETTAGGTPVDSGTWTAVREKAQ